MTAAVRDAIVLGAGMVGVATALHLRKAGWSVALVDRRPPGQETSYGNAGIVQAEAVEPYAMPRDWASLLAIASGRTNDVRYALAALPGHLGPLLRYWWHSASSRHAGLSSAYATLIEAATREHGALAADAGAEALFRRGGFRVLHRTAASMDKGLVAAERVRERHGVAFDFLASGELATAESSLADTGAGAIHWRDPWSAVDPGAVVGAYADLLVRSGGTIARGDATSLRAGPRGAWRVESADGPLEAGAVVVALGPWSPRLLARHGHRFPMVRKRGYHMHYRTVVPLNLPLMDAGFGYVMAPMARGTRITTGAELAGVGAGATPVQLERAEAAARGLLALGERAEEHPWIGTRPCMPDMLPVVGRSDRNASLWMNFGHGHQGFTLGPATGRLLAEMMGGEPPMVDPTPFRPGRY